MLRAVALACLAWFAAAAPAAAAAQPPRPLPVRVTYNVRYAAGAGARHTLDVFTPDGPAGRRYPVVLFVHGGAWMMGDKNFFGLYRNVGRALAAQGVVAVLCNYRLSPRVRHPEHVRDVADAFAWTYRNATRYGGDPNRIVLAGHSAGGHLVSLLATDASYLKDARLKLPAQATDSIKGVVAVCGVYRIPAGDEFNGMATDIVDILTARVLPARAREAVVPLLVRAGGVANPFTIGFGRDPEARRRASPLTHVRPGLPPFLLLYAQLEVPGLYDMADDFAAALRKCKVAVELKRIDDCTHKTIVDRLHSPDSAAGRAVAEFVRRHAGPPR